MFCGGILLTNVTVPPESTLAAGGVRLRISTVTDAAVPAVGASRTAATAAHSQPRTARAIPRRAFRRIRPVAMVLRLSDSSSARLPTRE